MVWASCPTHGPIQDASVTVRGNRAVLRCRCNLLAEAYTPEGFVEHEELKTLAISKRQPVEDHEPIIDPNQLTILEPVSVGGGWYELPDGSKVQGKEAAYAAMEA